jgi:hypothetical protein
MDETADDTPVDEGRRIRALLADLSDCADERDDLRRQLEEAKEGIDSLRSSTALAVGQVMVAAARDPWPGLLHLPKQLRRIWTSRGASYDQGSSSVIPPAQPLSSNVSDDGKPEDLGSLLASSARFAPIEPGTLVVAVVGAGVVVSDPHDGPGGTIVVSVHPNRCQDALLAMPDLLVVHQSSGHAGPWLGLGTGASPQRDSDLRNLLVRSAALGTVCVVVREGGESFDEDLHRLFDVDLVMEEGEELSLARLRPLLVREKA